MIELELVIRNKTGLHARPAKEFVTLVKTFKSDVKIFHGEKKGNAKSLISVLAMGVHPGGHIRLEISGEDEVEAASALEAAVLSGLGEEHMLMTDDALSEEKQESVAVSPAPVMEVDGQIRGVAAAPGIAIGPVFQFSRTEIIVNEQFTTQDNERQRLQQAFDEAMGQLSSLRDEMLADGQEEGKIFEVQMELMQDPELLEDVHARIADGQSAGKAWQESIHARAAIIRGLDDALLAERATDLHDIGDRVLAVLTGVDPGGNTLPDTPVIVVADDLTPSTTAQLDKSRVLAFITAVGGPTSHSAILSRALGIPAIVSAGEAILKIKNNTMGILNGSNGSLILSPSEDQIETARAAQKSEQERREAALQMSAEPAVTKDNHRVEVVANVGNAADAEQAFASGAEGIGLLRTEFLFLDRATAPSEEEQYQVYQEIVSAMNGLPVIFRTLDIGGDKPLPYIDVPHEDNPFLGERGIRLSLARPELMKTQLRAILRTSTIGPIRIMFPMIADLSEWRAARKMVDQIRSELGLAPVELGIMVEVPSTAMIADHFAKEVDFFSVGTNDLTQYTLAMDRLNPVLAGQADGLHPAVLRLIHRTVKAAHAEKKWVGVCGELAADPIAAPILIGLGVDELSVSAPSVASLKAQVREQSFDAMQLLAKDILACTNPAEVRAKSETFNKG